MALLISVEAPRLAIPLFCQSLRRLSVWMDTIPICAIHVEEFSLRDTATRWRNLGL